MSANLCCAVSMVKLKHKGFLEMLITKHDCPYDGKYCRLKQKQNMASFQSNLEMAHTKHNQSMFLETIKAESVICPLDEVGNCGRYLNYICDQETLVR